MANKTIIPIAIDDTQFKAFFELFQQFQGKVGELPADWDRVNASAQTSHEALAGAMGVMVESMVQAKDHAHGLAIYLKDASEAQRQFRLATQQGETGLRRMKNEAKELGKELFGVGKFVLKIGAMGFGAIAGSLFGLDKLAQHAVANQRGARGVGLTTGQYRAFQTDFGSRYLDEGVLDSVANARNDLTNRVWMQRALGISGEQMDRANTGDLAAQLAIKVHDWWASTPQGQHNEAFYRATGFAQSGISLDMARQLGNTDRGELLRARDQYNKDSLSLNVSDRNTDALYSFSRQVELAGRNLEGYFTNKLAQLGPSLGTFMTNLEKDAEVLLNGILTPANLNAIEDGISTLARYLGSDQFKADVKGLVDGVGKLGRGIASVLHLFPSDEQGAAEGEDQAPGENASWWQKGWYYLKKTAKGSEQDVDDVTTFFKDTLGGKAAESYSKIAAGDESFARKDSVVAGWLKKYAEMTGHNLDAGGKPSVVDRTKAAQLFGRLEDAKGLPSGILGAIAENESSYDAHAISSKGAQGLMQLMPEVSRALGVTNPYDWIQSAMGGAELYQQLNQRYRGDIRKQLAAWNWSPSALDKDVAAHGDDWESYAPRETQNFIARVLKTMGTSKNGTVKVELTLTNKSGTSVAASTNAGSM